MISSTTYRVTFNTDTGTDSAPQIILGTVTYEASVHAVTGSTAAPLWMNNATRDSAIKIDISNNSPAGFNILEVTTVSFKIMNSDLSGPLTTGEAKNLFNAIMLVRDSTSTGTYGRYESGIDKSTIAYVPMADISLDAVGLSTLTVLSPDLLSASIPAASTRTFYVVFEATQNASAWTPNVFRIRFDPVNVFVRDGPSDLVQDFTPSNQVDTSSITMIAPAQPPAGTTWPYVPAAATEIQSPVDYYTNTGETSVSSAVYVGTTDGYLRGIKKDGTLKWEYATSPLSSIRTSPNMRVEGTGVYIYFANDNGDVYKVQDNNASAGFIWKQPLGVVIKSSIVDIDTDPKFYFGANDNKVRCLNKSDGTLCSGWNFASAITSPVSGVLSIDNRPSVNTGWVGTEDGGAQPWSMVELNLSDGTSDTSYQTGAAIKSSPFLDAKIADANNVLYFTSTDGKLYARVSSNLSTLPPGLPDGWPAGDYPSGGGAAIYTSPFVTWDSPKYIFYGNDDGYLHKVSTYGVSAAGWPFQAGGAIRSSPVWVPHSAVDQGGPDYVYFGCDDGYIYAVNVNTKVLRTGWPVATGGPVKADPVIDPDNKTLVVGSTDGKTYVLYIGGP
ncbi:MAG: PQQ-binding-like beta-propeller repeat protein [Elusimicrobia bacterium]|nr:PQQ-binding-like beta-propeller repeat protein [Elusimicrobiota bacterium]